MKTMKLLSLVDGSGAELRIYQNRELVLGEGSAIVLLNGGTLTSTGTCAESAKIIIGGDEIANCPGANGALSFSQINTYGGINIGELPVTWLETKTDIKSRNEVEVQWSTASEENNSHFDIEFSIDGENWLSAGTVYSASDNGFSNEILEYKYTHYIYEVANLVYYRIKQTDHDGQFEYSGILTAEFNSKVPVSIGSLGNNTIKVQVDHDRHTSGKINVYDLTGNMIKSVDLSDNNTIQLDKSGPYIIEVVNGADVQRIKHYVS